ncbi:hypothetical protein [Actinomadura rugatobispora]|uniref:Serine peptidase n=1 Tax=Actinomadura rugatobispora TaxID=1994 RepID=A0ABW1A426_9ACTN|nr:hypothetical protein GCM10010200_005640 [Actinomadura rugatobispora]
MTVIIGVHGILNYRYYRSTRDLTAAGEAISLDWTSWLRAGLTSAGLREDAMPSGVQVAYYAHHLHRGAAQGPEDPGLLDDLEQDLLIEWVEQMQPARRAAQGPRLARARAAADWLTIRYGALASRFAMMFVRELGSYLNERTGHRRLTARGAVTTAIRERGGSGEPVIVVAHSLGSVVVYEALWACPELRVDLLVTLGSPLGMPNVVFDRLQPAPSQGWGERPPGVRRWINLADAGDLVALPRRGLGGRFRGIDWEAPAITIADWDFHTAKSYLRSPVVAAHLNGL